MIRLPSTLYTIHKSADRRAFSVHMEHKTYMMTFSNPQFARITAHILETHYRRQGSWPNTEVTVGEPLLLRYDMRKEELPALAEKELEHLYIQEWNGPLAQEYVMNNLFHMMVVEGDYNTPNTRCITFQYPESHIRRYIDNLD